MDSDVVAFESNVLHSMLPAFNSIEWILATAQTRQQVATATLRLSIPLNGFGNPRGRMERGDGNALLSIPLNGFR